jgi:chromosome condensin MukBEF complex kleisin-like MukF subunit
MTNIDILTKDDLHNFKDEILEEIKESFNNNILNKKWLKTSQVKELLNISSGTLKNLRETGELPYSKLGGTLFYDNDDIMEILDQNKR